MLLYFLFLCLDSPHVPCLSVELKLSSARLRPSLLEPGLSSSGRVSGVHLTVSPQEGKACIYFFTMYPQHPAQCQACRRHYNMNPASGVHSLLQKPTYSTCKVTVLHYLLTRQSGSPDGWALKGTSPILLICISRTKHYKY